MGPVEKRIGQLLGPVRLESGGTARVTVRPGGQGPVAQCTCPAGRDPGESGARWCAHIVAVLGAAADGETTVPAPARRAGPRSPHRSSRPYREVARPGAARPARPTRITAASQTPEARVAQAARRYAPARIWTRAASLVTARAVRSWRWQGQALGGDVQVRGEAPVSAFVLMKGTAPHPGCTCPHGADGSWCEHAVAVVRVAAIDSAALAESKALREPRERLGPQPISSQTISGPVSPPVETAVPLQFRIFRKGRDLVVEAHEVGGARIDDFGALLAIARGAPNSTSRYRRGGSRRAEGLNPNDGSLLRLLARHGRRTLGTSRITVGPDASAAVLSATLETDSPVGPLGGPLEKSGDDAVVQLHLEDSGPRRVRVSSTWFVLNLDPASGGRVLALVGDGKAYVLAGDQVAPTSPEAVQLAQRIPAAGYDFPDGELAKLLGGTLPAGTLLSAEKGSRHQVGSCPEPKPEIAMETWRNGLRGKLRFDYAGISTAASPLLLGAANRVARHPVTGEPRASLEDRALDEAAAHLPMSYVAQNSAGVTRWLPRLPKFELAACAQLVQLGFRPDDAGGLSCGEAEAIRMAADDHLTQFHLLNPEALAAFQASKIPVRLEVQLQDSPHPIAPDGAPSSAGVGGPGWFEIGVSANAGDEPLDPGLLIDLLQQGRRHVPLASGGRAEIPAGELARLQGLIDTVGAERLGSGPDGWKFAAREITLGMVPESLGDTTRVNLGAPRLQGLASALRQMGTGLDKGAAANGIPEAQPPSGLRAKLRDYQREGLSWLTFLAESQLGGILADDMGLGKTLQAIGLFLLLHQRHGQAPNLVVAPSSVVLGWRDELDRFAPDLRVLPLIGSRRWDATPDLAAHDVVLTSYALLRRDAARLAKVKWRAVVFDEAQFLKNLASLTAGAARQLQAQCRFALSGTPMENRLRELFALYDLVLPGLLGSETEFRDRIERPMEDGGDPGAAAARKLHQRIRPYLVRRVKADVLRELPSRSEVELPVQLTPGQSRLYQEILRGIRGDLLERVERDGMKQSTLHVLSALTRLRQVACDPRLLGENVPTALHGSGKLELLRGMIPELVSEGHAALIFSQFTSFLDLVEEELEGLGVPWIRLDGSTPTKKRAERVRAFQAEDGPPIFLISLKAGGTGLNLTRADYVFHLDPWWNPAVEDQATDRAHRMGQTRPVVAYRLVAGETVESRIRLLQERKRDLAAAVLGGEASVAANLTQDDLTVLLGG